MGRNECETLMAELEEAIQAPLASAPELLQALSTLYSTAADVPRSLPPMLVDKMDKIAAINGGSVPIHGRLMTQWMHYAFPYECPYPVLVTKHRKIHKFKQHAPSWKGLNELTLPEQDLLQNVTEDHAFVDWSDEEVLVFDTPA